MEISVSLMRKLDKVPPDLREILYAILEEIERQSQERVTKVEFRELKKAVQELAQAQSRTEAEMRKLAKSHQQLQKFGFQFGVQSKSVILFFMTPKSLSNFQNSDGWEAGVDGSVALANLGAAGSLDTNTLKQPIIGFVFSNKGLMVDLSLKLPESAFFKAFFRHGKPSSFTLVPLHAARKYKSTASAGAYLPVRQETLHDRH